MSLYYAATTTPVYATPVNKTDHVTLGHFEDVIAKLKPPWWKRPFFQSCVLSAITVGLLWALNWCTRCATVTILVTGLLSLCTRTFFAPFIIAILFLVLMHVDYERSSFQVEVPLRDVVPTWDTVNRYASYVHPSQK